MSHRDERGMHSHAPAPTHAHLLATATPPLRPQPPPGRLAYSPKSACEALDCGMTHLYKLIAAGRIEARKCGGKTLIPAESLLAFLNSLPRAELTSGLGLRPTPVRRTKSPSAI